MTPMLTYTPPVGTLRLQDHDRLGVELDGDRFLMRARSLTPNVEERRLASTDRYNLNGVLHYDSWQDPSAPAVSFFSEQLHECRWDKRKDRWSAARTDLNAVTCQRAWGADRIVFATDETRDAWQRLLEQFERGQDAARLAASFKLDGVVPKLPECWRERKDARLAPYQQAAAGIACTSSGFMLNMDRGTGKTATAIQRTCVLSEQAQTSKDLGAPRRDGGRMIRVLAIVPKQVRINWQREFEKFAWTPGRVSVMRGGLHRRIARIAEMIAPEDGVAFSVLVASYDSVVRTVKYLSMVAWDLVITDECHYYKDSRTDRWKAMTQIRDCSRNRLALSGSPIGNSPMDLWTQLEFLAPGASGFADYKSFKSFHGQWERVNGAAHGVAKLVGLQHIPLLQERLARLTFAITKEEAGLQLPDKVRSVVEVQMTEYQADVYRRLQDQLAVEIEDKLSGDVVDEITVSNVLTMLLRLAQITSGYITFDERRDADTAQVISEKRTEELSPTNPKVDALLELLQDEDRDPRAKCIVWCNFVHNIQRVSQALTEAGISHGCYYGGTSADERDWLVDEFNCNPNFKVLVCNPQTAGEGLNLLGYDTRDPSAVDTYCDMEVFFSCNWSSIQRAQAEDRAHRRGTRMPVQVIDLVVPGTIDEEIIDRVTEKRKMAETVGDLRAALDRVLGREVTIGD